MKEMRETEEMDRMTAELRNSVNLTNKMRLTEKMDRTELMQLVAEMDRANGANCSKF